MSFSFQKHVATGVKVYFIGRILRDIYNDPNLAVPRRCKLSRDLDSASSQLNQIRCRLDDFVCLENPNRSDGEVINVYYGAVNKSLEALLYEKKS